MPKQRTDDLVQLILSLTKAEKRHFRLFAKRNQSSEEMLFLQVFDWLDKKGEYEEEALLAKIPGLKKSQLPNLKSHLYRQILTSLRQLSKNKNEDIQVRETIDFARALYDKGLYRQSLDLLDKAKERALSKQFTALALEVLEFEKMIEGQYITRSLEGRADELASQTLELHTQIGHTGRFSNLSLMMYGLYLRIGFSRNKRDNDLVKAFFQSHLPVIPFQELDFLGKIWHCQSHVWLHYICQEFAACYRHAQRWVDLFEDEPEMKALHTPLYLKGLHNLLSALFRSLAYERFVRYVDVLDECHSEIDVTQNKNVEGLYLLYRYIHLINRHYLEGTFTEGVVLIPGLAKYLETNEFNWDTHRIMVFNYRVACLYFGNDDFENAIEYLNKIIQQKVIDYRADIQCFARILNLIAHFELGNQLHVEYQIRSVYRYLLHFESVQQVQREILSFLRGVPGLTKADTEKAFRELHKRLLPLENDPVERRPFLYLDIISWLESKLEGRSIQEVIRGKFLERRPL
ncbi:MAG: hypothetical protein H6577_13440 [Lewinellaceae bacterium]|nr:hypothetical protein [Lewinellaceae bacterium]